MNLLEYTYYNPQSLGLDFAGMVKDLERAQDESVVMLHVCSHNPTGVDPSQAQWQELKALMQAKKHIAFFDMAYQGFTTGDIERDAYSLRLFTEQGDIPTMLTQSFAKNMGLYGQRIGTLSILCDTKAEKANVEGQLKGFARRMYSNPPVHGARIVKTILSDPELYQLWLKDIKVMSERIALMRQALKQNLIDCGSKRNWDHITNQVGMFAFTGLSPTEVLRLREEFSIYMTNDGRISIAGLNSGNVA